MIDEKGGEGEGAWKQEEGGGARNLPWVVEGELSVAREEQGL